MNDWILAALSVGGVFTWAGVILWLCHYVEKHGDLDVQRKRKQQQRRVNHASFTSKARVAHASATRADLKGPRP